MFQQQTYQIFPGFSSPSSPFLPFDSFACCFTFVTHRGGCLPSFDRSVPSCLIRKMVSSQSFRTPSLPQHIWAAWLWCVRVCVLTGRTSAALCGARCKVTHVHRWVEPSYHSIYSLIQPCRLNQICGSQLARRCLNYFNGSASHYWLEFDSNPQR